MQFDFDLIDIALEQLAQLVTLPDMAQRSQTVNEELDRIASKNTVNLSVKKVLLYIQNMLEELKNPETMEKFIYFSDTEISSSALLAEEKWLIAWFKCQNESYSEARMWARLYNRVFTDDEILFQLKQMMPHYCKDSPEKLVGFVMWVQKKEGTLRALLTSYFVDPLILIHQKTPIYIDNFLEILHQHNCRLFGAMIQSKKAQQRREERYQYHADADRTFLENIQVIFSEDRSFFEKIRSIFGLHAVEQTLFFISREANIPARTRFKAFLESNIFSMEIERQALFLFAFEHRSAWHNLEEMFKDDGYFYFKQGLFEALLLMHNQPEQLARLSDAELETAMTGMVKKSRFRAHASGRILSVCSILDRKDRGVGDLKGIIKHIREYFTAEPANINDIKIMMRSIEGQRKLFSSAVTIRARYPATASLDDRRTVLSQVTATNVFLVDGSLRDPNELERQNDLMQQKSQHRRFLYGAAADANTLAIVLNFFKPILSLQERLQFIEKENINGNSIFLHAAQKSATLQVFLEWVREADWDSLQDSILFPYAATFPNTLQYLLNMFPPEKTLAERLAFILQVNNKSGESLLTMAAKNAATLKVLLNWFKQEKPSALSVHTQAWLDQLEGLQEHLNDPALSSSSSYYKALSAYIRLKVVFSNYISYQQSIKTPLGGHLGKILTWWSAIQLLQKAAQSPTRIFFKAAIEMLSLHLVMTRIENYYKNKQDRAYLALLSDCEVIFEEIDALIEPSYLIAKLHEQLLRLRPGKSCLAEGEGFSIQKESVELELVDEECFADSGIEEDICSIDGRGLPLSSSQIEQWKQGVKASEAPVEETEVEELTNFSRSRLSFLSFSGQVSAGGLSQSFASAGSPFTPLKIEEGASSPTRLAGL
ncbi:MAG: hypothetical protein Q8R79_05125 [Legionellaceae bacterium]|nr:hypothetical protein [Legionellaceae bacterium]